ncbi:NAD(P)-binding protein [Basidiobolus meristosporus CBS 931.73]|uniref:NAD(P)-binding protein n=1 Tax=Basidiobolus meristosporus CBS 931.73 TaxID=1314790 RepID=A0A1Y1YJ11_9FUNG|nr:NAD(P)-binding protein [Basidiobolus meristosporus CBS 931.73]|eukprot:ORX97969.1 NAD(P)-binding protein [Basidiobolus meristosporus CBS 931.73]
MSSKKLIAVVGATGAQGGFVVQALLEDGQFQVRGLTRNPDSPASKQLISQGVEMVKCDIDNPAELDRAFEGVYGVFSTTNTMESYKIHQPEHEITQGRNIADAAKKANVKHFIHSSLLDSTALSNGKYRHIYHFSNKARIEEYVKELGLPVTVVMYGYYMSNATSGLLPMRTAADGTLEFLYPVPDDTQLAPIHLKDAGKSVLKCFLNPEKTIGQTYYFASNYMTIREFTDIFTKTTGRPTRAICLSAEERSEVAPYNLAPLVEMYQFWHEFGYFAHADLKPTHEAFGDFVDLETYLRQEGYKGPAI